jgi:Na+-transporting NADH:ubiquinone oxidoreductase subunit F
MGAPIGSTGVDYGLTGVSRDRAIAAGLADAEWFLADVPSARMREFQQRTDLRAAIDTVLWLGFLVLAGWWAYATWLSWWSVPAFLVYGALYGGASDSRWHEMGHGTAFRSRLPNEVIYVLASFMLFRGPSVWRWSHHRHHTDTIIVGRDAEISFQRPANVARTVQAFTGFPGAFSMFARLVRHSVGRIDPTAAEVVPESEHRRVVWESRAFVAVIVAVVAWSLVAWTPLPLLFVGLPTWYGTWLMVFFGVTQHAGLRENVLDHRYNTRTVYMNPVFRFLYLNMNYHVEHHMFPSVPYRSLPALHAEIKDQLAPPLPNTLAAYRQIFSTLARQQRDPSYEIPLDVPDVPGARHRIDVGANWIRHADGGVDIAADDSMDVGELRRIDVDGRTYVLCRLADDEYTLADGLCTHSEVHLAGGALVDGQIECPKHNARFDARTGAVCRKPAREPISTYRVERIGGRLVGRLGEETSS